MTINPKQYHHDYYFGPEGMTEHDDWRQSSYDPQNQRPEDPEEHLSREPIHLSDEEIREHVSDALSVDAGIDLSEIELSVEHGNVNLEGTVSSRWMRRRVLADIAAIPGVKNVNSHLLVDRPADREAA